jgi:hypothetical protein
MKRSILNFFSRFYPQIFVNITLSNDTSSKKDGTGAQLQRMLAVAGLAEQIGAQFSQRAITDVAIHPLDPFQNQEQYVNFLTELNETFKFSNPNLKNSNPVTYKVQNLRLAFLIRIALTSYVSKKEIELVVENPYSVSDLNVDAYSAVVSKMEMLQNRLACFENIAVAIHYRQGVGNFVVYPGQSISREMEISYFRETIRRHFSAEKLRNVEVHIFTDAPSKTLRFQPPQDQLYLWEGTPGFSNGEMVVKPLEFTEKDLDVQRVLVHSGGDPIDAMLQMSKAELLILGRSSLSYVAGILSSGKTVVAAPEFWHPPLSNWKSA